MNGSASSSEPPTRSPDDDGDQAVLELDGGGRWRSSMRSGFRAFQHRNYRLLWIGQTFSVTGTWMQSLALSWLILSLTDSAFDLALVGAFQFGPTLVLGLAGGLIADRFPKRSILLVSQSAMAVLAGILALLVATDMIELWHVYVIALGSGVATAVDMPTRQSFVSELVPKDDLVNAVALNAALFNAGRVVGPALAGLILAFSSPAVCFGLNAASFLAPISSLLRMRLVLDPRPVSNASHLERLREGLGYVRSTPAILLPICLVGLVATFGMNFNVWVPLLAKRDLDTGATGFGILMSSLGVGSLFGALTLAFTGRGPRRNLMILAAAALGALEIALAFAGASGLHFIAAVPLLAGMGFSMSMAMSLANATVQSSAPDQLRGRVMSVYMTVFMGTFPIGSLIAGVASEQLGTPASIGIGGAVALGVATTIAIVSRRVARPSDRQPVRPPPGELGRGVPGASGVSTGMGMTGGAAQRSFASRKD
jgi:MFS family permease